MAEQKVLRTLLQYVNDTSSIQSAIQGSKAVGGALEENRRIADAAYTAEVQRLEIEKGGVSALLAIREQADQQYEQMISASNSAMDLQRQAVASTTQAVQQQSVQVQDLTDLYQGLEKQAQRSGSVIKDIGVQSARELPDPALGALPGESGGGGAAGALGGIRQAAIALPGLGVQSPIVLGLRAAEKAADATGASMLEVGAAGAITVGALAAVKIAWDAANKTIEDSKKILTGALSAQDTYYAALKSSTTEQVRAQISELDKARPLIAAQIAETQGAIDAAFQQAQAQFGDAAARALDAAGKLPTAQLREQLEGLNKEFQANEQSSARLTQAVDNNAFAANTAAAALEEATKQQEDYAKSLISAFDADADMRVRLADLRRNGTSEQIKEQIAANNDRIAIDRNFLIPAIESLGLSTEAAAARMAELNQETENLAKEDQLLAQAVLPVVEAREREAKAAQALIDKSDAVNEGLKELADLTKQLGAAANESADTLRELREAESEHSAKVGEIEADKNEAIENAQKKANERILQIDQQLAARTLAQRQSNDLTIKGLVARGDIAAADELLAQQKLREQQDKATAETQKDEAQKQADEQIENAKKQAQKLQEQEDARFAREYEQRSIAHARALEQERALMAAIEAQRSENALRTQYWNNIVTQSHGQVNAAANQAANGLNRATDSLKSLAVAANTIGSIRGARGGGSAFSAGGQFVPGSTPSANSATVIFQIDARGSQMTDQQFERIIDRKVVPLIRGSQVETINIVADTLRRNKRGR